MLYIDVELTRDWFYVGTLDDEGKYRYFEKPTGKIRKLLRSQTSVGFNSKRFDLPIISMWLRGAKPKELYNAADKLIKGELSWWKVDVPRIDHIDIMDTTPGVQISLKLYMARMHAKRIDDIFHDGSETVELRSTLDYNLNDLIGTKMLFEREDVKDAIESRIFLGKEVNLDLRSDKGAKVAERYLIAKLRKRVGERERPPSVRYKTPKGRVKFKLPHLIELQERIEGHVFEVSDSGKVLLPDWMGKKNPIEIDGRLYVMGIGGLHAVNKNEAFVNILDIDVGSYYPSVMIENDIYPRHLGKLFIKMLAAIKEDRMRAKSSGDKGKANALKLILNSTFGKMGERYSKLYDPEMMLAITLTGQLQLLNLIEMFVSKGIEVVSANTDGVSVKYDKNSLKKIRKIYQKWEKRTSMVMEETFYKSLHMRDVNAYFAILENGEIKRKNIFKPADLEKNPEHFICYDAVVQYVSKGISIEDSVRNCKDITKFVSVKNVNGGGIWNGKKLGRVVRWYYSTSREANSIHYISNGNKVGKTDGCVPVMELPDKLPKDIDYQRYIDEAYKQLSLCGVK